MKGGRERRREGGGDEGREGEKEEGRGGGREGGRERGQVGGRERGRKGGREDGREGGREKIREEGERERRREGGREEEEGYIKRNSTTCKICALISDKDMCHTFTLHSVSCRKHYSASCQMHHNSGKVLVWWTQRDKHGAWYTVLISAAVANLSDYFLCIGYTKS